MPKSTTGIVLLKEPGEEWQQVQVPIHPTDGIEFKTLQTLVGGQFDSFRAETTSIVFNDDGRALQLPPCIGVKLLKAPPIVLLGPVVVVANHMNKREEGIYVGIEPEDVHGLINSHIWIADRFNSWQE